MKVIQRDRILGISSVQPSLGTFSPGNMLDDSSRNVWVSSKLSDTLVLDCNSQVNSFFLGNMLVDSAKYSFFKKTLTVSSLTASGTTATCVCTFAGDRSSTASQPFTTGFFVRVTGSNENAFNIDNKSVTVTSFSHSNGITTGTFTFPIDTSFTGSSSGHTVQIYQKDGSGITLRQKSFATRYFASLGDFVQGVFVQSVSSFQDLPYDDEASSLEIELSNNVDRRADLAKVWIDDGHITDRQSTQTISNLYYNFNSAGNNHQKIIATQAGHGYSAGDSIIVAGVTGTVASQINKVHYISETTTDTWTAVVPSSASESGTASGTITAQKAGGTGQQYFSKGRFARSAQSITAISTSSGVSTVTFSDNHGMVNGDKIIITGSSTSNVNGTYSVTYVNGTQITIKTTASDGSASGTMIGYRPVNIIEFRDVMVGGFIELLDAKNNKYQFQVLSITGDGTASQDVKLNGFIPTQEITSLYLPVYAGILRTGFALEFPNAQTGLTASNKDYSVKKELETGSYYHLNRDVAKEFSGSFQGTPNQTEKFISFAQTQMGSPFAALVLQDMGLNEKTALYAYFTETPSESFSNKIDSLRECQFSLREVL